jgi:hypothetical protein
MKRLDITGKTSKNLMKIEDVWNNASELQQSTTGQILAAVQLVQQLLGDVEARLSFSHLHVNISKFLRPN